VVRACRSHTRRLPSLHTTMSLHAPSLLRLTGGALSFKAGSMRLPAGVYTCSMPTGKVEESSCRLHMLYAFDQNICRALHIYQQCKKLNTIEAIRQTWVVRWQHKCA